MNMLSAHPISMQRALHRRTARTTLASAKATPKKQSIKQQRSSDESRRRAGFKSVETREDFRKLFGDSVKLPSKPDKPSQAGLQLQTHLTDEAASYLISTELAPSLALSSSILRIRNEKARYLVIYEILKVFAKLAQGHLILEARSVEEALADSEGQHDDETEGRQTSSQKPVKNDEKGNQLSAADKLLLGFEETLESEQLSGPVEFLVFAGSDTEESGPIRFVCEAKSSLALYWDKATWQFLAQLTTAAQIWGSEETYGALTDALEWHFFRIQKLSGNRWAIQAAMPLNLASSAFVANDSSTRTVTMLLQSLFARKAKFELGDLTSALKAADEVIESWAQAFTEEASALQRLRVEIEKLSAENERLQAEFEKLQSEKR